MKLKKSNRIAALLLALTLGFSGNALAAEADTDMISDSELEAIVDEIPDSILDDVPRDHWSYEALDELTKAGIVDGYSDGSFQGGRTMSRYEMAAIVAKAMDNMNDHAELVDVAVLEMLQDEYQTDLKLMKNELRDVKIDVAKLKKQAAEQKVKFSGFFRTAWIGDSDRNFGDKYANEKDLNRNQLVLQGEATLSPQAKVHFESDLKAQIGRNNSDLKINDENGIFKSIWMDGTLKNGMNYSIGRRWESLGYNFSLLGAATTGARADMPITKRGLRAGAYYYTMSEYKEADFSFYGPYVKGPVAKNLDIYLAYAKINKGKFDAINRFDSDYDPDDGIGADQNYGNWVGSKAWVVSAATQLDKNWRLTADFAKTNHVDNQRVADADGNASYSDANKAWIIKLDYKWTNPDVVGSFGGYIKYHHVERNGTIYSGDEYGSILRNSKGITIATKYVPWKNIEWELLYQLADCNMDPYADGEADNHRSYKRHYYRTMLDFHF